MSGPKSKKKSDDKFISVIKNHSHNYSQIDKIEIFSPFRSDFITSVRYEGISQGELMSDGLCVGQGYFDLAMRCDGFAIVWNTDRRKGVVKIYGYM